jgi:surface antigen
MRKFALALSLCLIAPLASAPAPAAAQGSGLGSLFGCDAAGGRDTAGALIGGLVGGLAGSQVSKNERTLGAVVGAGLGAAVGANIGCRMDRQAQQRAQSAFQQALETGQTQRWSDPETGASGQIEVVGRAAPNRRSGPEDAYEAINRANVRAQPNINAPIVDRLQVGERIRTGRAVNGWLPLLEDGQVQGYVSSAAVRPAYAEAGGGCRVVQQTITAQGYAPETQRYNACRDPAGGWRVTAI